MTMSVTLLARLVANTRFEANWASQPQLLANTTERIAASSTRIWIWI
jgi:hypothetical protein